MKFNLKKTKMESAQSILEYLIVLSAIIVVIIISTIGFNTGIQNSLGLQNSLNTTQSDVEVILNDANPPINVTNQSYYTPPSEITSNPNSTDTYGGPQYTGGYDYNNWVNNNPDNGNINRTTNNAN
ncbi:MAG: hypothetical protein M0R20_08015, partial [Candidatus Omnitrophica bacterium]|nr:hypothetical protein [Candidatus Omnitrophota bacterium]